MTDPDWIETPVAPWQSPTDWVNTLSSTLRQEAAGYRARLAVGAGWTAADGVALPQSLRGGHLVVLAFATLDLLREHGVSEPRPDWVDEGWDIAKDLLVTALAGDTENVVEDSFGRLTCRAADAGVRRLVDDALYDNEELAAAVADRRRGTGSGAVASAPSLERYLAHRRQALTWLSAAEQRRDAQANAGPAPQAARHHDGSAARTSYAERAALQDHLYDTYAPVRRSSIVQPIRVAVASPLAPGQRIPGAPARAAAAGDGAGLGG